MNPTGLFINGVYETVLEEILQVQTELPEQILFLQPYSSRAMVELQNNRPSVDSPVKLYLSITTDLPTVRFKGEIGGVYSDRRESHATIARAFVLLSELLEGAVNADPQTRAVLVFSDFRGVASLSRRPPTAVLPSSPGDSELFTDSHSSPQRGAELDSLFASATRMFCGPRGSETRGQYRNRPVILKQ